MASVTVIVPTYRRPALLDRCLAALAAQDLAAEELEVVVVDDGSNDRTDAVLERWEADMGNLVALRASSNAGPAAARNRALAVASGALVLFVDDDIVAPRGLVRAHLERHRSAADPRLGVLGRVDWHPDLKVTPFMRWLDRSGLQFAFDTWLEAGPVEPPAAAFYTCNLSVPTAVLRAAGGFDERFPYPAYEDMELAWRLADHGFHLEYLPSAVAWHARPITLRAFRARMAKVGESAGLLAAIQPDFPLDSGGLDGDAPTPLQRLALRAMGVVGGQEARGRWYRAEVKASYAQGSARGRR